jgi:hypothetical protein
VTLARILFYAYIAIAVAGIVLYAVVGATHN